MENLFLVYCFPWSSYVEAESCPQLALINNKWAEDATILTMETSAMKELVMLQLNKRLDGEFHSFAELGKRPESAPYGGLCGVAALYQALFDTILTPSQLTNVTYDKMREILANEMNVEPFKYDVPDADILDQYHQCIFDDQ